MKQNVIIPQNYAFIFPEHPYMIRCQHDTEKTRKEILSELMWVDDLKQFKQTICGQVFP